MHLAALKKYPEYNSLQREQDQSSRHDVCVCVWFKPTELYLNSPEAAAAPSCRDISVLWCHRRCYARNSGNFSGTDIHVEERRGGGKERKGGERGKESRKTGLISSAFQRIDRQYQHCLQRHNHSAGSGVMKSRVFDILVGNWGKYVAWTWGKALIVYLLIPSFQHKDGNVRQWKTFKSRK